MLHEIPSIAIIYAFYLGILPQTELINEKKF